MGAFLGTFDLRRVYLFVLLSSGLSLIVYFVVTLLPAALMLPAGALLFFASVAFCRQCLAAREPIDEEFSAPVFKGALSVLWRPVLGTSILAFMSGLMLQLSMSEAIPLGTFQFTALITQAAVIAALLLPALLVKSQPGLGSVYRMALPLSAAGFLLLPLIWNGAGGLANACAQLGTLVAVDHPVAWWRIRCTTRNCRQRCCSRARLCARTPRRWPAPSLAC